MCIQYALISHYVLQKQSLKKLILAFLNVTVQVNVIDHSVNWKDFISWVLVSKSSRHSAVSSKAPQTESLDRTAGKIIIDWSYLLL